MNVYGELIRTQLENLSADPSAGLIARVYFNTASNKAQLDNGTLIRSFLVNDAYLVVGNHATANNNVRLNRSATSTLQLLLGGDTTAEGSAAAISAWGILNAKLGGSNVDASLVWTQIATPSSPSSGTNLLYFKTGDQLYTKNSAGTEFMIANAFFAAPITTYQVLVSDDVISANATSAGFTITLISAATAGKGKKLLIKREDTTIANSLTIARSGSDTIAGSASSQLLYTAGETIELQSDGGTNWAIINRYIPQVNYGVTLTINGFGTTSLQSTFLQRRGDSARIRGYFKAGTTAGTTASLQLPTGYVIDTAKLTSTASVQRVGHFVQIRTAAGPNPRVTWTVFYDGSTNDRVFITFQSGSDVLTKENGSALIGTADGAAYDFELPISGWAG